MFFFLSLTKRFFEVSQFYMGLDIQHAKHFQQGDVLTSQMK